MANLRLIEITSIDSVTISAKFTDQLSPLIGTGNVTVVANLESIPDPTILSVKIIEDMMEITTTPLTPFTAYVVTFKASSSIAFKSLHGNSFLIEDGTTNAPIILGAEDPGDETREFLLDYLKDNVYNLSERTLVRDIINSQAIQISQALHDIKRAQNDNYLSLEIIDEIKTRGVGPFDRFNKEGVYQLTRVSPHPTGTTLDGVLNFDSFPTFPINLTSTIVSDEILISGSGPSTFDQMILNLGSKPVSSIEILTINYEDGYSFIYDPTIWGYGIQNNRLDPIYGSSIVSLTISQIQLSNSVLEDFNFRIPRAGDSIQITYRYLNLGKVIDPSSVIVSQVLSSLRESTPALSTFFALNFAPVVSSGDILSASHGVSFLDPRAFPAFSEIHPAFLTELPFNIAGLPRRVGEFSIDYSKGLVYVYGSDDKDGTGVYPPIATYFYRKTFDARLDYTFDQDTLELVASPLRDLGDQIAKISFQYDQTLVEDSDFVAQIHRESLNERIENRVNSTTSLSVDFGPITNVFRVFNETSGELYKVQRWSENTIYFTSNNPPRIENVLRERASFTPVTNETLLIETGNHNILNVLILKIFLANNSIVAASDDSIGSSFNSSVSFSRTDLFSVELYFDGQTQSVETNTDRLVEGQYQIDYPNGVIYIGISENHNSDLGTVNYKKSTITTANPRITSVSEVYQSLNNTSFKILSFTTFDSETVSPLSLDFSDERFTDSDTLLPYVVIDQTITVTDDLNGVRGIFDHYDLTHAITPTNFADGSTISANIISLNSTSILKQELLIIKTGLKLQATFLSDGIEISSIVNLIRVSDYLQLTGTLTDSYEIQLGATATPLIGQEVLVSYYLTLNGSSTPIVDYNRGDFYLDYTYLLDEILVSYEYGDNCLDYRQFHSLDPGEKYFVSYKVGALRDALLKNFGTLVNLPDLNNSFDVSVPRENYRDALTAALQCFTKGPTLPAIKALVSNITHIEPEIIESAFQNWSLGLSHLAPSKIATTGTLTLLPAVFDNGILITNPDETISFPVSNNLRLDQGTLEMWIIPEWDGLDNDATLMFSDLNQDGYTLDTSKIWIGATSFHPISQSFSLNKTDIPSVIGVPSAIFTEVGLFIYFDDTENQWKFLAKNSVNITTIYSGKITSSGEVYNVKFLPNLGELTDIIRTNLSTIDFSFHLDALDRAHPDGYVDGYISDGYRIDGYFPGYSFDGIQFMADEEHYLIDFGEQTKNRFSIFKDGRGYLNFRIIDKFGSRYQVSANVSDWSNGRKHHLATSWKINTTDQRDELHLFLDGIEVPNILKYGGRPIASSTDRFRTIKPEIIAGIPKNTITFNDLQTTTGSNIVSSPTFNFDDEGIIIGNSIIIREISFSTYTITAVNEHFLTLNNPMPASLTNGRFSINEFSTLVTSAIDLFSNITVGIIHNGIETEIPGLRADLPGYEISQNIYGQNILTLLGYAKAGDQLALRTLGLNHRRIRGRKYLWGSESLIRTQFPPPINLDEVKIISIPLPRVVLSTANGTLFGNILTSHVLLPTAMSNSIEGRTLHVKITGNNVNFSTPVTVTLTGTTSTGPTTEILTFNSAGEKDTSHKFKTVSGVVVAVRPIITSKNTLTIEIKETFAVTYSEGNNIYPVIRYSYQTQSGNSLQGHLGSGTVTDVNGYFGDFSIGQAMVISSPGSVASTYTVTDLVNSTSVVVSPVLPATFTNGIYGLFNFSIGRSGFQNGFFTLQQSGTANTLYRLPVGFYELDYSSFLEIPFDPFSGQLIYLGSDISGNKQAKAILDEILIRSVMLTDVRIGESLPANQNSITTDFQSLSAFRPHSDTLFLLHTNSLPLINSANFWVSAESRGFLQSSSSINQDFGQSILLTNKELEIDNKGYLTTSKEGTVEFWISPRYDTFNDPNFRFYFDAGGSVVENINSITSSSITLPNTISQVLSVRLQTDVENSGVDFFQGGSLSSDFKTINVGRVLPGQRTPVKIAYIPSSLSGDRISIFKDQEGFLTFNIEASGNSFQVRQPIFWEKNSWHRIKATFKMNGTNNRDEIRLFVDGDETGTVVFGSGLLFGQGVIFGQGLAGIQNRLTGDINFLDPINQFYLGSDFRGGNLAQARMDNLKISSIAVPPLTIAGQNKDGAWAANLAIVEPVIEDAFTTYLLNFDTLIQRDDNSALIRDEKFGIFNFIINIIDSFDIVSDNPKIKQILETLIHALSPAQSKVTLNYVK